MLNEWPTCNHISNQTLPLSVTCSKYHNPFIRYSCISTYNRAARTNKFSFLTISLKCNWSSNQLNAEKRKNRIVKRKHCYSFSDHFSWILESGHKKRWFPFRGVAVVWSIKLRRPSKQQSVVQRRSQSYILMKNVHFNDAILGRLHAK